MKVDVFTAYVISKLMGPMGRYAVPPQVAYEARRADWRELYDVPAFAGRRVNVKVSR